MVKGCQREMIVMQTQDSPLYESAYFVLRRERSAPPRDDMLAEANRIIESGSGAPAHRSRRGVGVLLFAAGMGAGLPAGALLFAAARALFGI